MAGRLSHAVSPYLQAHADDPVDWWPWGEAAFAEAERRDVPLFISIGYSTCHWCHVMQRESFRDPATAAELNAGFVAVKVDREEHPDVDAAYLAAASAFTPHLGWPLTIAATPTGRTFFAGTYFPLEPRSGVPSLRQVLGAVLEAWTERRDDVEVSAQAVVAAMAERMPGPADADAIELPDAVALGSAVDRLLAVEDGAHGGFGAAPKFPVAPVLLFLARSSDIRARELAARALAGMAAGGLRDPVEGGFFRYATRADWSEPHYERMLTDNAQLLDVAAALVLDGRTEFTGIADGIAGFLLDVLRDADGTFGSGQDSESPLGGVRSEGGYYALSASERAVVEPPAIDRKVVTGWNGLAIGALADAGLRLDRPEWIRAARGAADRLLGIHRPATLLPSARPSEARLARASRDGVVSDAAATLEDAGLLADGLLRLALAAADPRYAETARALIESSVGTDGRIRAAGGPDPVLASHGLVAAPAGDDGASPSASSAFAGAAFRLWTLSADPVHRALAAQAVAAASAAAVREPIAFGATLGVLDALARPGEQLVVVRPGRTVPSARPVDPAGRTDAVGADLGGEVSDAAVDHAAVDYAAVDDVARDDAGRDDAALLRAARDVPASTTLAVVDEAAASAFSDAGFALFDARTSRNGRAAAYLCRDFVCALPVSDASAFRRLRSPAEHPDPPPTP